MAVHLEHYRFSLDEYEAMVAHGILTVDDRIELLRGAIVNVSPIGSRHASCVRRLNSLFVNLSGDRAIVSIQSPVAVPPDSEPEPDVAILRPPQEAYETAHPSPTDVLLVVEVSDSSIGIDRKIKLPLYAECGIPEYWIVDLTMNVVEVYTEPRNGRYDVARKLRAGEFLEPSFVKGTRIRADDVFPKS